jgi:hypothetical protein
MQTRYANFSIWDDELEQLIAGVSNQSGLDIQRDELTAWFHKRGGDHYNISESITIGEIKKASLNKKGHYPDFTVYEIIGIVACSLESLCEEFIEQFAKEEEEQTKEILIYHFNHFQAEALKCHKPFYNLRAEITSSLNEYYKSKMKSNQPADESSHIKELLIQKKTLLEGVSPKDRSDDANLVNAQLLADITAYMDFVESFDLTVDTLTPGTRTRVLPVLPTNQSTSLNSQSRSKSISQQSQRVGNFSGNSSPYSFLRTLNFSGKKTASSHAATENQFLPERPLQHSSSQTFESPPGLKT